MSNEKVINLSMVVVGALLIQLSLGAIYAWSVFTKPLVVEGWSRAQTQAVFSAGLALFAIIMVLAGRALPMQATTASMVDILSITYILQALARHVKTRQG